MWNHQVKRNHVRAASVILGMAIFGTGVGLALGQDNPPPPTSQNAQHQGPGNHSQDRPQPQLIDGEVQGYNLTPQGDYNAVILKDGDRIVQFNFRPDAAATVTAAAPVGKKVQLCGEPESRTTDRATYHLVNIIGADGQKITVSGPDAGQKMHAEGTVKQLNYTPNGEVDGAILDTGDFIHVGPRSAAALNLSVGQKITADGRGHAMTSGHNVIEADEVNGQTVERPKHGPGERGGPGDRHDTDHSTHGPRDHHGQEMDGPPDHHGPQDDGETPMSPPGQ